MSISHLPTRAARWSANHPWGAILGWLLLVAVAVGLAATVPTRQTSDADGRKGDSGRADAMIATAHLQAPPTESILITPASGGRPAAAELAAAAARLPDVTSVGTPETSPDGKALLVSVELQQGTDDVGPLQAVTTSVQRDHPELRVRETGDVSLDQAIDDRVAGDLGSAERWSLPVTLILMLVAFGAMIAAGIPVLLAATSVAVTVGITAPLSHLVPSDPTVTSMIVLIGMAVGVDYSLFFLARAREERAKGSTTEAAVEAAARTSGHSILVSGGAVAAAMAGLYLLGDATFDSLATGAIMVVAVAVLGSITVLPALLVKLGRWVDRPRVPLLWRVSRRLQARLGRGGIADRVLAPVVRHPRVALGLTGIAVVALSLPALGMRTHSGDLQTLPGSIAEVQTMRDAAAAFPSQGTTAEVVVTAPATDGDRVRAVLADLRQTAVDRGLADHPGQPVVSSDGGTWVQELPLPWDESDPRVDTAIRTLRTDLVPAAMGDLPAQYAVGGDAAESLDYTTLESQRLPWTLGFVLLLVLLLMGRTFRSLPIAVLSAVLDLASVGVAFGLMTLVFQHGWGQGLLGFQSSGFVIDWLPWFVLVVLVGLSMDYHVFVLSRVREHVEAGLPTREAVRRGIADTAGVVTSAAAVMVSVFAIFATLSMVEMKTMGVALSGAILLDATLVRLVMLPAALVLLGERAWWPARRRTPHAVSAPERELATV